MSTDLLEAPAPSGKDAAYYERRTLIQGAARHTLKRRRVIALTIRITFAICTILVLIPLFFLVYYVCKRGIPALSVAFFTHTPTPEGIPGGGISNAIVGSLLINGLALIIAMPFGLLIALFLVERRGPIPSAIRFGADVLSGLPSILIGLFAYAVIVVHTGHFSAYSASAALAVLMLPIIIRGDEEAMRTVPNKLWEAGLALGARRVACRAVGDRAGLHSRTGHGQPVGPGPGRRRNCSPSVHGHREPGLQPLDEPTHERHPDRDLAERQHRLARPCEKRVGSRIRPHGRRAHPQHHRSDVRRPLDQEISIVLLQRRGEGNV